MTLNKLTRLCKEDKQIALHVGVVILLIVIVVGSFIKLEQAYITAQENKKQIVLMQSTIDKYNKLATKINAEEYKPIDKNQLDYVQTEILTKVQNHNLLLKNFDTKKDTAKETNSKTYNITVQGSWQNIVIFLDNFSSKDALISMEKANFQHVKDSKNDIECELSYKVYIK